MSNRPKETFLRAISKVMLPLWGIRAGLYVTFLHLFRKKFTVQYPEKRIEPDPSFRGKISLLFEPGSMRDICISCLQCMNICPVECIHIIPSVREVDGKKKRFVGTFDVDLSKCLFCGLCEETCPESCIVLDPVYDYSSYSHDGLYLTVAGLKREATKEEFEYMRVCKTIVKDRSKAKREEKSETPEKTDV